MAELKTEENEHKELKEAAATLAAVSFLVTQALASGGPTAFTKVLNESTFNKAPPLRVEDTIGIVMACQRLQVPLQERAELLLAEATGVKDIDIVKSKEARDG